MPTQSATNLYPSENGSTFHILTHLFMAHSTLLRFEVEKPVIAFLKMIGTSLPSIHPCSATPFPDLMFLHTLFTSTAARTCNFTIRHCPGFFYLRHHEHLILPATGVTPDKRSLVVWLLSTPKYFFRKNHSASYESSLLRNPFMPFIPLQRVESCGAMPITCHFLSCHPFPSSAVAS